MTDREFWMAIRQALLMFVSAIERKYKLGKHKEEDNLPDIPTQI